MIVKIFIFATLGSGFIISAAQENTTTSTERNTFGNEAWNDFANQNSSISGNEPMFNSNRSKAQEKVEQIMGNINDALNVTLSEDARSINDSMKSAQETGQEILKTAKQFEKTKKTVYQSPLLFFARAFSGNTGNKK